MRDITREKGGISMTSPTQLYSYRMIKPKIQSRKDEILHALSVLGQATAREIKEYLKYTDGNAVKPRLTELLREYPCRVRELHKPKWDNVTQRYVTVYTLIHEDKQGQIKMLE